MTEKVEIESLGPQELPGCENCMLTLGQCLAMTSCVPCLCEVYSTYLEEKRTKQ